MRRKKLHMRKKLILAIAFSLLCPVMAQGSQQEITENIELESPADIDQEITESIEQESTVDIGQENPEDSPITLADAEEIFEEGRKAQRGSIKVVDLSGSWFEMGRQYGALMKKELDEVLFVIDAVIEYNEGNASKAKQIVETQTLQTPWRISQFYEGAAETSGFTVEQLQLANAIERIGGLPKCSVAIETDLPEGLLVSTNYYVNPDWLFAKPSDEASWEGLTRRSNLIKLCEAEKGKMTEEKMMRIIETPIKDGGAENELTVYQLVVVPGTMTLWLRVIGGSDWTPVDLGSFLIQEQAAE